MIQPEDPSLFSIWIRERVLMEEMHRPLTFFPVSPKYEKYETDVGYAGTSKFNRNLIKNREGHS